MADNKASAPAQKKFPRKTPASDAGKPASELIDARIAELDDWRGETLKRLRAVILGAAAGIQEEWKWNVPVWSCNGIICTGETYKKTVKLTFAKGAALDDPAKIFNSSLDGNTRRAIDFAEAAEIDETGVKALVVAAIYKNGLMLT